MGQAGSLTAFTRTDNSFSNAAVVARQPPSPCDPPPLSPGKLRIIAPGAFLETLAEGRRGYHCLGRSAQIIMLVERSTSGGKAFFRDEPVVGLAPGSGL